MQNRLLQFFKYDHLPAHLQAASKPFGDIAQQLEDSLPNNAEKTTAFRKLLEAKDCAVRAVLYQEAVVEGAKAATPAAEPQAAAA